jgi:hypothetical protein
MSLQAAGNNLASGDGDLRFPSRPKFRKIIDAKMNQGTPFIQLIFFSFIGPFIAYLNLEPK